MTEIAVKVVEPGGRATAQLVPDEVRCSALIESLIRVLELPGQLTYELVPTKTREAIAKKRTLRKAGVKAGDTLRLEVVRNAWFRKLLDKLFDEAKDYLRDELIDMAKRRLETIERLDPGYPDLDLLRQGVDHAPSGKRRGHKGRPAPEEVIVVEGAPPTTPIPPYRPPTVGSSGGGVASTGGASRAAGTGAAPKPPPASSSAWGCVFWVVVVGGIVCAANWDEVRPWAQSQWERLEAALSDGPRASRDELEGTITAGSSGLIEIVDHNRVLDFAYQLYVNDRFVGDVRNPAGGTTSYPLSFSRGLTVVELRFLDANRAKDTRLQIRINRGEFTREFTDDGTGDHQSFRWVIDAVNR